jgi:hypothetical protein
MLLVAILAEDASKCMRCGPRVHRGGFHCGKKLERWGFFMSGAGTPWELEVSKFLEAHIVRW